MSLSGVIEKATAVRRFLLLMSILSCCAVVRAESRVIKCTDAQGRVAFTQTGCAEGVRERLRVVNPRIGWIEQKADSGSRRGGVSAARHVEEERSQETRAPGAAQRERCWRAEQRIARIDAERRHGYRIERGRELHRQREEWEDYLQRFCE